MSLEHLLERVKIKAPFLWYGQNVAKDYSQKKYT